MKKIFTLVLAVLMVTVSAGALAGCGPKGDYVVGIVRIVSHPALDLASKGFKTELKKLMEEQGKTVGFADKQAGGEIANASTISKNYVNKKYDMILGIATPAALQALMATKQIPIMFTAVTDPEIAKLVTSKTAPGGNVSGTSDLNPIKEQFELIKELLPDVAKVKVAVMYNNSEQNSKAQFDWAKKIAATMDMEVEDKPVTDLAAVETTVKSLGSDIHAIYIPTDNMLADAATTVHTANLNAGKLPIVCGEINMNQLCGIATYGIDYEQLGQVTAKMAFEVLFNGADISKMPVKYANEVTLKVNTELAAKLGFTIPQSVIDKDGTQITPDYSSY